MSQSSVLHSVIQPKPPVTASVKSPSFPSIAETTAVDRIAEVEDMELITSALVENAPVAMAMFDRQMRYVLANRQWIADFGLRDALPVIGRSQFEVFPNLNPGWKAVYDRALQGHVVRSEHDVLPAGPGGRPMVFRWEVRPWRRSADASVMGIMVTCEKFTGVSLAQDTGATESNLETAGPLVPECGIPMLALDAGGRIWHANTQMSPLLALPQNAGDNPPLIWNALQGCLADEQTVIQWKDLLMNVITGSAGASTLDPRWFSGPAATLQWTLCLLQHPEAESLAMLVGSSTPFAVASEPPPEPLLGTPPAVISDPATLALEKTSADLERHASELRRELADLKELESTYRRREVRHREVLDTMPCGLIVLDERGRPIFQNAHVRDLVGRELANGGSVEQWLLDACPDEAGRQQAVTVWRDDVWRRQLTRTISLSTTDGLVKDLEFRPCSLPQGGLLLTIHDVTDSCRLEEMLASVEAKFRTLLRECPLPLMLTDVKGSICDANAEAEQFFQLSRQDLRRICLGSLLTKESEGRRRAEVARIAASGLSQATLHVEMLPDAAKARQAELRVAVIKGGDGRPHALAHYLIPSPSGSEASRLPLPAHHLPVEVPVTAECAPAGPVESWSPLLVTDELGRIQSWEAPLGEEHFGWAGKEMQGQHLHRLFKPSDATTFYGLLQEALASTAEQSVRWSWFGAHGRRGEDDFKVVPRAEGGMAVELHLKTVTVPFGQQGEPVVAEMPQLAAASGSSDSSRVYVIAPGPAGIWSGGDLKREQMLLTETHHRVKNHLQIISSLLNLQSNNVEDEPTRSLLRSSQNRVRAIAALHQHLYEMQLGQSLSLGDFARELVARLRECFEVGEDRVKVELNLSSPKLHDEWLMPMALILNEALSNAFKHAFPDGRRGTIRVSLSVEHDGAHLRVEDDGVGLPEGFGGPGTMGLGLKVLGVFADQMRGQTSLKNIVNGGLRFDLLFPITCVDI